MNLKDLITTAFGNTMRSKARTFLTVIAIFIGAFTLTLTSGLGVGINKYVDTLLEGFGQEDQIYVSKMAEDSPQSQARSGDGPAEYQPEDGSDTEGMFGPSSSALNEKDIEKIKKIDGVDSVEPMVFVSATYFASPEGEKYRGSLSMPFEAEGMEFASGAQPAEDEAEMTLPKAWLESFGFSSADDAVGKSVTIGMTNVVGEEKEFEARISGVTEALPNGQGGNPVASRSLNQKLYDYQSSGMKKEVPTTYGAAVATVPDTSQQDAVKAELTAKGMQGVTFEDQVGVIRGIINSVTWVLNGFALIALLAAAFGIVNTLLMSVQERTREIGLMKSLGMPGAKIFGLFSMEAVAIGVLGSLLGIGVGVVTGTAVNAWLTGEGGPLGDVAGMTLYGIAPLQLLGIMLLIMLIAFIAGTLPAARAARKDPIESLRYE